MLHTIEKYVLLFFIYSIAGWTMEVVGKRIREKRFINRGFLIGPYCPIYGHGAILITLILQKYKEDPIALFVMGVLICSILEYLTSYFMEKIFHARWWDYSKDPFNINGRICLRTMIPFGLLGMFIMYVSNPFLLNGIDKMPEMTLHITSFLLLAIFFMDNIISFKILHHVHVTSKDIKDNTEEISEAISEELTQKVKNALAKKSTLHRRLIHAFPEMKIKPKNYKRIEAND